jgi:hypothetical protein
VISKAAETPHFAVSESLADQNDDAKASQVTVKFEKCISKLDLRILRTLRSLTGSTHTGNCILYKKPLQDFLPITKQKEMSGKATPNWVCQPFCPGLGQVHALKIAIGDVFEGAGFVPSHCQFGNVSDCTHQLKHV